MSRAAAVYKGEVPEVHTFSDIFCVYREHLSSMLIAKSLKMSDS